MAAASSRRIALMAIHPNYAEAILSGQKRVEFRKRPLAGDIYRVLIYATSPVQQIIGSFSVDHIVQSNPADLWDRFGDVGCIDSQSFDGYYFNSEVAYAIIVKETCRFDAGIPLSALEPPPPIPQSFMYLEASRVCAAWDEDLNQLTLFDLDDVFPGFGMRVDPKERDENSKTVDLLFNCTSP